MLTLTPRDRGIWAGVSGQISLLDLLTKRGRASRKRLSSSRTFSNFSSPADNIAFVSHWVQGSDESSTRTLPVTEPIASSISLTRGSCSMNERIVTTLNLSLDSSLARATFQREFRRWYHLVRQQPITAGMIKVKVRG